MGRRHWGIKQKKSLGQVFLKTNWPVAKTVERLRQWKVVRVLEIGPGPGILTRALIDAGFQVTCVEKDDRFVEKLEDYFRAEADRNSIKIVGGDVLKFSLENWLNASGEHQAVVGNIPYNISTPIIMWLLPHLSRLRGAHMMFQLEFAARVAGIVGSKSYGSLSVDTQLRAKVELECKVDRNCFKPVPKVDSALLSLRPKSAIPPAKTLLKVELLARAAFTQRRKQLRNSVKSYLGDRDRCSIDLSRRAESMRPDEFIQLAEELIADES